MSKNTVKKGSLWSVLVAIVLVAAAVVCALLGVNKSATMKDMNTLTISMNRYAYTAQLNIVEDECEKAFASIDVAYKMEGDMSGDNCEIVYFVDADVDLSSVKETIKANLTAKMQAGAELEGAFINVTTGSEVVLASSAKGTALRAAIATAVFAVLALVYTSIRYNVGAGIVAAIVTVLGSALSTAVILLARIPVSNSVVYVGVIGAMVSAAFALLNLAKMKSVDSDNAEEVVSNGADKEINTFTVFALIALVVVAVASFVGAGAISTVVWFAVMAIVAVVVAWFLGNVYMPALYLPFVKKSIANADNGEYKGAEKTSTREKKVYQKKAAPVKEEAQEEVVESEEVVEETAEEAPVEEVAEEATEETPVEEVVEETAEEAPVEEVVEETAEEAPVEEANED